MKSQHKLILDKIIKPEYRTSLNDWHQYAKEQDFMGLAIIAEIYKSKGTKYALFQLPEEKIPYQTQMSFHKNKKVTTLEEAEQKFRRKQLTTSYQFYHGGLSAPKQNTNVNIFQFKSLQKLELSRALQPMAVQFIDNWLQLKDDRKYQKLVLSCLRSINSKVHLSDSNVTEMKTSYNWKNDWNLSKPLRLDKAGQDLYVFKPNIAAIQKQEQKQRKLKQKLKDLQNSDFAKQMHIFKDFKIN